MKEIIISVKKLIKKFESENITQTIINDLNLDIYKKDFTIIMGSSGAGKSTLMYSLSGMDKPTKGNITFDNKYYIGRSYMDIPETDGTVIIKNSKDNLLRKICKM